MTSPEEGAPTENSPVSAEAQPDPSPPAVAEPAPVPAVTVAEAVVDAVAVAGDPLRRLFPVVRCEPRIGLFGGDRSRVLALFAEGIVAGTARGDDWRDEDCLQPGGANRLAQRLSWATNVTWAEVRDAVLVRATPLDSKTQLRLRTAAGRSLRVLLPPDETPHLIEVLREQLGDRFQIAARIPFRVNFTILLLQLLCLAIVLVFALQPWDPQFALPLGIVAFVLILATLGQIAGLVPRKLPHEIPPKPAKPGKDRSGREPFRSRFLGGAIRLVCGLFLLMLFAASIIIPPLLLLPFVLVGLVGLYAGHMLAQVPPKYVEKQDQRPPILYLRSFLDDNHGDLDPDTRTAYALGVRPPKHLPSPWRYILLANPLRVLRLMFGLSADTAEEQLGLALRKRGPFVAIGKPGEWFATPGANRMYVTNETWQGVVLDYLAKSQVVLLQPAKTPGVLWELKRSFEHSDPRKLLLCLVNFQNKANDYETFRTSAEEFLPQPLPRSVPFQPAPCFLYFDAQWKPVLQPLSYFSEFSWPLRGSAANLEYSLSSFFAGLEQSTTLPAVSRRTFPGHGFLANVLYVAIWPVALSMLPMAAMLPAAIQAAQRAAREAKARNEALARGELPPVTEEGPNLTIEAPPAPGKTTAEPPADPFDLALREIIQLRSQNKPDDALAAAERLITEFPDKAAAYRLRGEIHDDRKALDLAIADYSKAIELDPMLAGAYNDRAVSYLNQGKVAEALADLDRAIELNPNYALALRNRGFIHFQNDRVEQSLADYSKSLEIEPQAFDALYYRGSLHIAGNRLKEALADFNLALQINPKHADAYNRRGVVWTRGGRPDEALADFNKAIEYSPRPNPQFLDNRASNLLQRNNLPAAQADLEALLAADPKRTELLSTLGVIQQANGKQEAALKSLGEFARLNPQSAAARRLVFITQHAQGKIDDALATLKQAHAELAEKAAPADANALAWIAVLIPDRIDDWKLPLELSQRALDAEPKNLEFQLTRAAVQIRAGEPQPAAEALRAAISQQKGDGPPMQFALLALAEVKLEKLADARQAFDMARTKVNTIWPPDKRSIPVMNWAPRIALEQLLAEVEPLLPPAPKRPEPPRPPAEEPEAKAAQPALPPQTGLLPAKIGP